MSTHPIPVDAFEASHLLVVGTTGSGKTYLARGLIEQLRRADRRVGAIDKLGKLWGLTLSADGAGPGLEFVICGGKRSGAVPMQPSDGLKLGRLFVERNLPAIFDLSQWAADDQEQWVADFADAVFRHNEGALHLAIDEAQSFVPVNGGGPAFNAVRRLAEQGRGNGVNLILTAPRLSRVDATVRGAMQGIVAMRQTGTNDRAATAELLSGEAAIDEKALRAELPSLPTGTGIVWIPGAGQLERIAFPANSTFDSSRTPRHGDKPPAPIAVSSALVDELRAALAPPGAEPHPDDAIPADKTAAYRRGSAVGEALVSRDCRIAELEEQLQAATRRADLAERAADALLSRLSAAANALDRAREHIVDDPEVDADLAYLHFDDANSQAVVAETRPDEADASAGAAFTAAPMEGGAIRGRRALQALAAFPDGLTEQQWAWVAGLSRKGGTWSTYRGVLRSTGHIEERKGRWFPTPVGQVAAGPALPSFDPPGPALARKWGERISGGRKLVEVLIRRWPHWTTREGLAADIGMAAGGGTFLTYLGRLRGQRLLEEQGKRVRLSPELMGRA